LAVSVWVGGLAVLVGLGAPAWRAVPVEQRAGLVREVVPRFSRIAIVPVVLVVATGIVNSIAGFSSVSDLWRVTYGRVVLAKVIVEGHIGQYTAQVFFAPSAVGANQLHLTFVDAHGLAAAQVTNASVSLGPVGGGLRPVAMRLISAGHFVGDVRLPAPGRYRVS